MRSTPLLLAAAFASASGAPGAQAEGSAPADAFAQLQALAGDWEADLAGYGKMQDTVRLISNGAAVEETLGTAADNEASIYTRDADRVLMTHYCAMGNQPHVKLDRDHSRPDHLIFLFDGGTNLNPKKDMHIHGLTMTFQKDGHVISDWEGYMGGKSGGITSFVMTRE